VGLAIEAQCCVSLLESAVTMQGSDSLAGIKLFFVFGDDDRISTQQSPGCERIKDNAIFTLETIWRVEEDDVGNDVALDEVAKG